MAVILNLTGKTKVLLFMIACSALLITVYMQTDVFTRTSAPDALSSRIVFLSPVKTITKTMFNITDDGGKLLKDLYQPGFINPMPHLCLEHKKNVTLLIIVASAPENKEARLAIRKSWGSFHRGQEVVLAFMVGIPDSPETSLLVNKENSLHQDVIVNRNVDSYRNLTLKTAAILQWVLTHCRQPDYILKADDDMFINVPRLLEFLITLPKKGRVIYGLLAIGWGPHRNIYSKYYVSTSEFSGRVFPNFTTGPAYLMTSDVPAALYEAAMTLTFLPLEDVFFTGVVAQQVGVARVLAPEFTNTELPHVKTLCSVRKNIAFHQVLVRQMEVIWRYLDNQEIIC